MKLPTLRPGGGLETQRGILHLFSKRQPFTAKQRAPNNG